jgi:hypothetical protein
MWDEHGEVYLRRKPTRVVRRAIHHQRRFSLDTRVPKVRKLALPFTVHQDIRCLQVPVQYGRILLMEMLHPLNPHDERVSPDRRGQTTAQLRPFSGVYRVRLATVPMETPFLRDAQWWRNMLDMCMREPS